MITEQGRKLFIENGAKEIILNYSDSSNTTPPIKAFLTDSTFSSEGVHKEEALINKIVWNDLNVTLTLKFDTSSNNAFTNASSIQLYYPSLNTSTNATDNIKIAEIYFSPFNINADSTATFTYHMYF